MSLPIIETQRLALRPLRLSDEPDFLAMASDWGVASMTSDIPHPLLPSHAKAWLAPTGNDVRFAIDLEGRMIGSVGYFRRRSGSAELGFWLGARHWGMGFATEAAAAAIRHGLSSDGITVFSSAHFVDNPASGRVLAKLGFRPVGRTRMWCSARGYEVETVGLWLTREWAEAALGPLPARDEQMRTGQGRFVRWLDQARKALRDQVRT